MNNRPFGQGANCCCSNGMDKTNKTLCNIHDWKAHPKKVTLATSTTATPIVSSESLDRFHAMCCKVDRKLGQTEYSATHCSPFTVKLRIGFSAQLWAQCM